MATGFYLAIGTRARLKSGKKEQKRVNGNGQKKPLYESVGDLWKEPEEWDYQRDYHVSWAHHQIGKEVDPYCYPYSILGAHGYLQANGIEHFSGKEIARPLYVDRWSRHFPESIDAGTWALPARAYWPRLLCPVWLAQILRWKIGEPITWRHGWRPDPYNGGASQSDHLHACAADITVHGGRAYSIALETIQSWFESASMELSIGFYSDRQPYFHIGVAAPQTMLKASQAHARDRLDPYLIQRAWDYCGKAKLLDTAS